MNSGHCVKGECTSLGGGVGWGDESDGCSGSDLIVNCCELVVAGSWKQHECAL